MGIDYKAAMFSRTNDVERVLRVEPPFGTASFVLNDFKLSVETVLLARSFARCGAGELLLCPKEHRLSATAEELAWLPGNVESVKPQSELKTKGQYSIIIDENGRYIQEAVEGRRPHRHDELIIVHTSSADYVLGKLRHRLDEFKIVRASRSPLKLYTDNWFGCADDFLHYYREHTGDTVCGKRIHAMGGSWVGKSIATSSLAHGAVSASFDDKDIEIVWKQARYWISPPYLPTAIAVTVPNTVVVVATGVNPSTFGCHAFGANLIEAVARTKNKIDLVVMGSGQEVDLRALLDWSADTVDAKTSRPVAACDILHGRLGPRCVTLFKLRGGGAIRLIGDGMGALNNTGGNSGHPPSNLDLVWAQYLLLAAAFIWDPSSFRLGVQRVPKPVIHSIQRLDLEALGVPFHRDTEYEKARGIGYLKKFEALRAELGRLQELESLAA